MPRLIAHRGFAAQHPENTLAAFDAAVRAGADAIELDLQFSADGEPVVVHDATLDRVSGRPGCVWSRPAAEVLGQPAHEPARLGAAHVGTSVPSLAAAVALLAPHPVEVFVELKAETLAVRGVAASVARVLSELAPLGDRYWLISFLPAALQAARDQGAARIGWCLPAYDAATRAAAEALAPDLLFADQHDLGPTAAPLWPGPWRWASWELGADAARARALVARGCDYLETYDPAGLRAALGA
jgi:glycerophosphoryl diester phosphodiesterase